MAVTLAQVIKQVESASGRALVRFEPDCYKALQIGQAHLYASDPLGTLATIERANRCSPATAEMLFASSWGLYQDMGFELWGELMPNVTVWDWLAQVELQDGAFIDWCKRRQFDPQGPLPSDSECARFAHAYNGPGDVVRYVNLMQAASAALGA